jgi:hypothetical protein
MLTVSPDVHVDFSHFRVHLLDSRGFALRASGLNDRGKSAPGTSTKALDWIDAWPNRWQQESGCGWAIASNDGVLGQISVRTLRLLRRWMIGEPLA